MNRKTIGVCLAAAGLAALSACQAAPHSIQVDIDNDGIEEMLCKPSGLQDFEELAESGSAPPPAAQFVWYRLSGDKVPGMDLDPLKRLNTPGISGRELDLFVRSDNPEMCQISIDNTYRIFNLAEDGKTTDTGATLELRAFPAPPGSALTDLGVFDAEGRQLFYAKE